MNVDILPTVLGAVNVELAHPVRGHDLLRPGSRTASAERDQYAEYEHLQTLKRGALKLIHAEGSGRPGDPRRRPARGRAAGGRTSLLFDVAADPDEASNLVLARPRKAESLRVAIDSLASIGTQGDQRAADSELFEQLRALGYVQ
jgi:hypothetical protein